MDFIRAATEYRNSVLSGEIPACALVKLACKRSERDHANAAWPFEFSVERATRACKFVSLLTHVQGPLAGSRVELQPWQAFILTEMFGWQWKSTGTRRFRRAYIEVPKGNGKSLLASAISLYLAFADQEKGADVICTASSYEQSRIVLDTARNQVAKDNKLASKFGLTVKAHKIEQASSTSRLRGLPAKGSATEGSAVHGAVLDELHLSKTRAVYDSLRTASSKRPQAMLFCITTAGNDISGICYEVHTHVEAILNQEKEDESFFGIIYGLDDADDWTLESSWQKANPNWNVSVDAQGLREEANRAMQLASMEEGFKTKHLDIWVGSFGETPFLDLGNVRKCYQADLADDFDGQCTLGVDLASRLDLACAVRLQAKRVNDQVHYYAFCSAWNPSETIKKSQNSQYAGWVRQGWLSETPGNIIDLSFVENHLADCLTKRNVRNVHFDPLQSSYLVTRLMKSFPDKVEVFVEMTQSGKYFTPGMLLLEELVAAGRIHTNSPLLLWCMSNLRAKKGVTNLLFPTRPKDMAQKIDGGVALIMALTSCAATPLDESTNRSVYEDRGIFTI